MFNNNQVTIAIAGWPLSSLHQILGLHRILLFQIRLEPDLAGFGNTNPDGAGFG